MPDPNMNYPQTPGRFGRKGAMLSNGVIGDAQDPTVVRVVVASVAGGTTLELHPVGNAAGVYVTFSGVPVGFIAPFEVDEIGASTTCTVSTIEPS